MNVPIVDSLAHPMPTSMAEFASYLPRQLASRFHRFTPPFNMGPVAPPVDEAAAWAATEGGLAGSDPLAYLRFMDETGIDQAVLAPVSRGLVPDVRTAAYIAAAINDWLAEKWLDVAPGRFYGSIRLSAREPALALAELERWAGDERFVQVVVTQEAVAPYGQEQYFPIWEAIAAHGLPVMVVSDRARESLTPVQTPFGTPPQFLQYSTFLPYGGVAHLGSLIAEGVFERLPTLKFVFADGGFADAVTLLWRMTMDWRGDRAQVPWVLKSPMDYLGTNARFVVHAADGPLDPARFDKLVSLCGARDWLLFGTRFPYWDSLVPSDIGPKVPVEHSAGFFRGNALDTYPRLVAGE
jgi:predicted TIM-barrel fold metal-dependent hydrolase